VHRQAECASQEALAEVTRLRERKTSALEAAADKR
jgi:hypothetical protein